ncbi:MAG: histidine kinase dimerization/phospho-acceptor domain-containing protein, partial [Nitrospirota bacterium]|nr:histidine kinase dimerization/phospho-acceptor domain-containing protein [Nitrospirota bacterium]
MIVKKSLHLLTGKLIIAIGTLMVVVSAVFWYFLIQYQERELIKNSVKYGVSFTDYLRKSTRHGMLTFQAPLIQQTVEALGSAEGVKKINIFDSKGKIAYSSFKEEIGTILSTDSPVCRPCHAVPSKLKTIEHWSISKDQEGNRVLNIVEPIYNEPACYTAACHAHPKEQKVLGLMEADLSLTLVDETIKKQKIAITAFLIGFICLLSVVLCTILWKIVSVPLSMLTHGMKRVAAGELDYVVEIKTKDEMGELAKAFNAMTADLLIAKKKLIEWGTTLEKKVEEKTEEIRKAQAQLVHSEKLASLGRMAAGVAHEINSPLTGIVTFSHLLLKKFPEGSEEKEDINVIIEQANRCSNIIKGLLGFARATSVEKGFVNLNDVINSSLNMIRHKADFFNIKIVLNLDETLPPVMANASQLQQVFLNMIINAADAMEGKGTLTIATRKIVEDGKSLAEVE